MSAPDRLTTLAESMRLAADVLEKRADHENDGPGIPEALNQAIRRAVEKLRDAALVLEAEGLGNPTPDDVPARISALESERAELRGALERALPLLCLLGNYIGNGPVNPNDPESLGERCDVILAARTALARGEGRS